VQPLTRFVRRGGRLGTTGPEPDERLLTSSSSYGEPPCGQQLIAFHSFVYSYTPSFSCLHSTLLLVASLLVNAQRHSPLRLMDFCLLKLLQVPRSHKTRTTTGHYRGARTAGGYVPGSKDRPRMLQCPVLPEVIFLNLVMVHWWFMTIDKLCSYPV
jgi:hypothetical protein